MALVNSLANGARRLISNVPAGCGMSSVSWFKDVPMAPKDPILGVTENFNKDDNPEKMNLGVGAYRDDNGKPVVLKCVAEAERRINGMQQEYLPIAGLASFCQQSVKLAYGADAPCIKGNNIASIQALSGTGAVRLLAEFAKRFLPGNRIYLPKPTWSNHHNVVADAGLEGAEYLYYKAETRGLDFEGMMGDLQAAPEGSIVLLHACAHNPTGVDPDPEQWREISQLMLKKSLMPYFDMAYQVKDELVAGVIHGARMWPNSKVSEGNQEEAV